MQTGSCSVVTTPEDESKYSRLLSMWCKAKTGVSEAFHTFNGGKAHRLLLSSLEDLEAINTALVDRVEALEARVIVLERSDRFARRIAMASVVVAIVSLFVVLAR